MEELLKFLVEKIIAEEVGISRQEEGSSILFKITVPQEKIGMVIGKQGKVIKAIKTLLNVRAKNEGLNQVVQIEIVPSEEK